MVANEKDPAMIESITNDIEIARKQALLNVNNYFDRLIQDARSQAQRLETELVNSRNFKDLQAVVQQDQNKIDRDLNLLDAGDFVGVLQEYDTREPNKKYDTTSLLVSEFLRKLTRPKLQLHIDNSVLQTFPD
jgi:hypothetical protein